MEVFAMRTVLRWIAILAMLTLGACATAPGPFNGLGSDEMSMLIIYRTDDQPLTKEQYDGVTRIAQKMGIRIGWQLSSAVESAATSFAAYGVGGYLGGSTQSHFYAGALRSAAAGYTGVVYGLGGVINGMMNASYANIYAVSQTTEIALRDEERAGASEFFRVHVVAAFIRSKNTADSPATGLAKQMPDWKGPKSGTPVQK